MTMLLRMTQAALAVAALLYGSNNHVAHAFSSLYAPNKQGSSSSSSSRSSSSSSSTTRLYISSWDTKRSAGSALGRVNPFESLQEYLPEPRAVSGRSNCKGTVLVSGCVNAKDRTDQLLFDLLNQEVSALDFTKIVAFVQDVKFSKKRLLSRSARYTGLLDKLDFVQASSSTLLPTTEQLVGVNSWVAVIDNNHLEQLQMVRQIATSVTTGLENVAILLLGANKLDANATSQVLATFPHEWNPPFPEDLEKEKDYPPLTFTIAAVGQVDEETADGECYYHFAKFGIPDGVIPADVTFPRSESYRLITELLQLTSGRQRALSFSRVYNINVTEAWLLKGLREGGYARSQEIDHMVRDGPAKYQKYVEDWKSRYPDWEKGYTTDIWWEAEIYQEINRKHAEREAKELEAIKDVRTKEVEKIAKEWVKREYYRQRIAGTLSKDMTEEAFREQVWERAMVEADIKYRQSKGEIVDSEKELTDFKTQLERKKQVMLQRVQQEMAELLEEDPNTLFPPEVNTDDGDVFKQKSK